MACRACGAGGLDSLIDLGDHRLTDFRDTDEPTPSYPLHVLFCDGCGLAQLDTAVPRELMYHERYGFKSGVNASIRADLQDIVIDTIDTAGKTPRSWLDIASNDGTLLSFVPKSVYRAGIDPVAKYCREAEAHADHVTNAFFHPKFYRQQQFDIVTSISMFYDIDDPNDFVEGVKKVLSPNGLWAVQQNYLLPTLQLGAVDNFCHEHITYFSLYSLEQLLSRHGLEVVKVQTSMVNGGSIRTFIARTGVFPVDASVQRQRDSEADASDSFDVFSATVGDKLRAVRGFVQQLVASGKTVFIYGASTRGGTLWQAAGIDHALTPVAVERNPEKVGKWMSSIGVPIVSEETARRLHPDYMLVSPWFFRDEFVEREKAYLQAGGKLIFPLPELEIVG